MKKIRKSFLNRHSLCCDSIEECCTKRTEKEENNKEYILFFNMNKWSS